MITALLLLSIGFTFGFLVSSCLTMRDRYSPSNGRGISHDLTGEIGSYRMMETRRRAEADGR